MPCNTITTVSLELEVANFELLKKALESLGKMNIYQSQDKTYMSWTGGSYDKAKGLIVERSIDYGNQVRKAYTVQVVKKQASRFGWNIKQTAENKFAITKR